MPFTTVPGARLYWKLEGRGDAQPLVLLNSIGTDMNLWDGVLPELRERFSLLRMDTRGHGASTADRGDFSLGVLALDVLAVADAAGFGQLSLAGVSLGGMIGMQLALDHPDRLQRLALVCTSAKMDPSAWADRVTTVRIKGMAAIAELAMSRFLSDEFIHAHPSVAATVRRHLLAMDPQGYAGCAAAIRDMDLADRLTEIVSPTLVVTGRRDVSTPLDGHGAFLLKQIAGAQHVALDAAHLAPLETPEPLGQALRSFMQG